MRLWNIPTSHIGYSLFISFVLECPQHMLTSKYLIKHFNDVLQTHWLPPADILRQVEVMTGHFRNKNFRTNQERAKELINCINEKFGFDRKRYQSFLDDAAAHGVIFNYHEKSRLAGFFNREDYDGFSIWIKKLNLKKDVHGILTEAFRPISKKETLTKLHLELSVKEKKESIFRALFGAYIFSCFPIKEMHKYFNKDCRKQYNEGFYEHLLAFYGEMLRRDTSLIHTSLNEKLLKKYKSTLAFKSAVFEHIKESYEKLSNHCYFSVLIEPIFTQGRNVEWELYSDIVLFAEKFREVPLKKGYFDPEEIENKTSAYIPKINKQIAKFELANEGFFYKDCFVISFPSQSRPSLLLLFQKNERDERLIPCPACRSTDVQGNSYPVLGVRSWECNNPLCPDRSKYDRGKRYSLESLIKQEAIECPKNAIPIDSLRKWKLDVIEIGNKEEIHEWLLRHYTLYGSKAVFVNTEVQSQNLLGREIESEEFKSYSEKDTHQDFFNSSLFHRFRIRKEKPTRKTFTNLSFADEIKIYNGDSYEVLNSFHENTFDGAVTSPPYYNARSYSQWKNIYCYLYDMFNIGTAVFRVLKTGAPFLFNIFDYFDNENSIVFSAMGKKRMILGAYIIHLFQEIGFVLNDNIVWHKGEIEGKRNFNQGNISPYYQAPFNCWEHVFVFSKGQVSHFKKNYPLILKAKPVLKMIRGENILGHTAPYPKDIPMLLVNMLEKGASVLDPFSGSMTTGRTAYENGLKSVNIELHENYCELGLKLLSKLTVQPELILETQTS